MSMAYPLADKVLPSVLQKAEVSILSQTDCKKSYGPVSPRMVCAGVPSGERDACRVRSHLHFDYYWCVKTDVYSFEWVFLLH